MATDWERLGAGPQVDQLHTAINIWAPGVQALMQQIQTSVDEVRTRLIDFETKTGAAVTQGAARIKETAEEVVKTG